MTIFTSREKVSLENDVSKFVEKETVKKQSFVDNGLLNAFLTNGETALLEKSVQSICIRNMANGFSQIPSITVNL